MPQKRPIEPLQVACNVGGSEELTLPALTGISVAVIILRLT